MKITRKFRLATPRPLDERDRKRQMCGAWDAPVWSDQCGWRPKARQHLLSLFVKRGPQGQSGDGLGGSGGEDLHLLAI